VRRPRTKGKVERMVYYIKDNFLNGRTFADMSDLRAQAQYWLAHTANSRVHATTNARPCDLLADEKLCALSSVAAYKLAALSERKVDAESFVRPGKSRYSVPPESAALDRLLHRCTVIDIRGESYRLKEKRQATKSAFAMPVEETQAVVL
jgi:hypothetical protein